jgi:hypothetical protein
MIPVVQLELTRYLSDNRVPVIERDVDGPHALPLRLDREVPNLGRKGAERLGFRCVAFSHCQPARPKPTMTARLLMTLELQIALKRHNQ